MKRSIGNGPSWAFNLVEEIEKHGCMVGRLLKTRGIGLHQRGEALAIRIEIQRRDDARVGKRVSVHATGGEGTNAPSRIA